MCQPPYDNDSHYACSYHSYNICPVTNDSQDKHVHSVILSLSLSLVLLPKTENKHESC